MKGMFGKTLTMTVMLLLKGPFVKGQFVKINIDGWTVLGPCRVWKPIFNLSSTCCHDDALYSID